MTDIVKFLNARIDEDEALARAAIEQRDDEIKRGVYREGCEPKPDMSLFAWDDWIGGPGLGMEAERLLAECEAKRAIVNDCTGYAEDDGHAVSDGLSMRALTYLAKPYADHPDYDPAWVA